LEIRESAENYLECMLMLREQYGYIRSVDISQQMGVTKPSVTYATKRLRNAGCIEMNSGGFITLTERGMEIARRIYERHRKLTALFMDLGVDEETAREDACKVEHDLSEQTYNAICRFVDGQGRERRRRD